MLERRNSIANTLELRISCTNPSNLWSYLFMCIYVVYVKYKENKTYIVLKSIYLRVYMNT